MMLGRRVHWLSISAFMVCFPRLDTPTSPAPMAPEQVWPALHTPHASASYSLIPRIGPTLTSNTSTYINRSCNRCREGLGAGGEGDGRGWDGWMASPTWWAWVWVNFGSWWWTGRPGMLRFMGSQRVGHGWVTELNWIGAFVICCLLLVIEGSCILFVIPIPVWYFIVWMSPICLSIVLLLDLGVDPSLGLLMNILINHF